jgi:hypothetical protein
VFSLGGTRTLAAYGGIVVNTIFGPVAIGGGVGDSDHRKFFFQLGRLF